MLLGPSRRVRRAAGCPLTRRRPGCSSPVWLGAVVAFAVVATSCGGGDGVLASAASDVPTGGQPAQPTEATIELPPGEPVSAPPGRTAGSPGGRSVSEVPPFSVVATAAGAVVEVRAEPDGAAPLVVELANPTRSGAPLVFRVVEDASAPAGWLQVQLPIEPNGSTGWIRRDGVTLSDNPYRVHIDRASFSLTVYHQGQPWLETAIAVGTGETPTPVGEFYLRELLQPADPGGVYGPYAFGLSGFSEVLDSFGGLDQAIIGIHGTNDPAALGTTVSKGCVRVDNTVIEQMAAVVPLGTPVVIT